MPDGTQGAGVWDVAYLNWTVFQMQLRTGTYWDPTGPHEARLQFFRLMPPGPSRHFPESFRGDPPRAAAAYYTKE